MLILRRERVLPAGNFFRSCLRARETLLQIENQFRFMYLSFFCVCKEKTRVMTAKMPYVDGTVDEEDVY